MMNTIPSRRDKYDRLLAEKGPAYKIHLSYIGTRFSGFQSQTDRNAVQDHLEKALATLLRHPVRVRGASRTDSGVHAQEQVAVFRTKERFSGKWLLGLNALLPPEIGIHSLTMLAMDFDPITDAHGKAYRYRLWHGRCFNPFLKPFVWGVPYAFDPLVLAELATQFVGRHDFASFCNRDSAVKTTVREIFAVHVEDRGPLTDIWICGEGFLKQMVRIMVGTMVEIAAGKLPRDQLQLALVGGRRELAGTTAPALGLSLVELFYDEVPALEAVVAKAEAGYCLPLYGLGRPRVSL